MNTAEMIIKSSTEAFFDILNRKKYIESFLQKLEKILICEVLKNGILITFFLFKIKKNGSVEF